jgi:TPR repeat protein
MKAQGSTEPDIFSGENAERSFVECLYLWFRGGASAWLGTAAELLDELKARSVGLEHECWPENSQLLCGHIERNAELLRSYGLEVHIHQQDNGPRLISIRPWSRTPGLRNQDNADLSTEPGDKDEKAPAVNSTNDIEPLEAEDQAPSESADSELNATPAALASEQQREPSADVSDPSDWHDIRNSLSGFDTVNSDSSGGIGYRIVITCIVILAVLVLLVLFAWLWPKDQKSEIPNISHADFAPDNGPGEAAARTPVGVPHLLEQSRLGDADAQYLLGLSYETGNGVAQDFVNAYVWYVIADASGNPKGKDAAKKLTPKLGPSEIARVRSRLGFIYASGVYVPKDQIKGYVWYSLAVAAGDPQSERERKMLSQQMTEEQIAEANNRIADWLKKHEKQVR